MKTEDLKKIVGSLEPLSDIDIVFGSDEVKHNIIAFLLKGCEKAEENPFARFSHIVYGDWLSLRNKSATFNKTLIVIENNVSNSS